MKSNNEWKKRAMSITAVRAWRGLLLAASLGVGVLLAQATLGQTASNYRVINVSAQANPFLGPPEREYGGSKHVWLVWHPVLKRVYNWGGDFGTGAASFGQPDAGATLTTNDPVSPKQYRRSDSLNNDQYSIDPYATGTTGWRLEHPYLPRVMAGGAREVRPGRPDQVSLVWDSKRNKLWGLITVLRTEFLYFSNGVPDLWANGDMTTSGPIEPTGTWSFVPDPNGGGVGAWTLETDARVAYRAGEATRYEGKVLVTGNGDERIANWEYDPKTDRIVSFGFGRIFVFNPATKTYEHHGFEPAGYSYFNPCSTYVGILGDWMYGVALARRNDGTFESLMVRVNIPKMVALANGASVPSDGTYWETFKLPWSLSPGAIWEARGDGWSKWQEHAGVVGVAGKIVVVASYDGLVENGVARLGVWDPATKRFTNAELPPDLNIVANSWVALPDSGEVLFGLNTFGYTNTKLWAYKVGAAPVKPKAPTNLQAN